MTTGAIYLCGGDFTCYPDTESDCPDRDKHTPMPSGPRCPALAAIPDADTEEPR